MQKVSTVRTGSCLPVTEVTSALPAVRAIQAAVCNAHKFTSAAHNGLRMCVGVYIEHDVISSNNCKTRRTMQPKKERNKGDLMGEKKERKPHFSMYRAVQLKSDYVSRSICA